MSVKTLLRIVSRVPGVASDLADWYDEAHRKAEAARRAHDAYLRDDPTDKRDMTRWVREPKGRRPAPEARHDQE